MLTTEQKLWIIQREFEDDFKIESIETETCYGDKATATTYEIWAYIPSIVLEDLTDQESEREFIEDGIASCLGTTGSECGDTIEVAINKLFSFLENQNYF